jgi:hypothetical protein
VRKPLLRIILSADDADCGPDECTVQADISIGAPVAHVDPSDIVDCLLVVCHQQNLGERIAAAWAESDAERDEIREADPAEFMAAVSAVLADAGFIPPGGQIVGLARMGPEVNDN